METVISFLESPTGIILLGLVAALIVLSIFKKFIKLAIVLIVGIAILTMGKANIAQFKDQYQITKDRDKIEFVINDQKYSVELNKLKGTELEVQENGLERSITLKTKHPIQFKTNILVYYLIIKPASDSFELNVIKKERKGA